MKIENVSVGMVVRVKKGIGYPLLECLDMIVTHDSWLRNGILRADGRYYNIDVDKIIKGVKYV